MNTEIGIGAPRQSKQSPLWKYILVAIWLVLALCVMIAFERREAAPSQLGVTSAQGASALPFLSPGHESLVMFAHPQCPCTGASLSQLDHLMLYAGKAKVWVVFLKPKSEPVAWVHSNLWQAASKLKGVRVLEDLDGKLCQSAGAYTSGLVVLYSSNGAELFRGGLTASRGHEGESAGLNVLKQYFETGKLSAKSTPVFGCSLITKSSTGDLP
jgi:hypothetical protein